MKKEVYHKTGSLRGAIVKCMDQVLKELQEFRREMKDMETRLGNRIDATEARLHGMEDHISGMAARFEERMHGMEDRIGATEARLVERIENTETKLLKAFYGWGRTSDLKVRLGADRVSVLEDRVTDIEQRLSQIR